MAYKKQRSILIKKMAIIQYDATVQTPEKLVQTVEAVADGKTYKVSNVK